MTDNSPISQFTLQLAESLEAGLTEEGAERVKRQAKDILGDVLEDIQWRLQDDAASNIAFHVQDLFKRGFEAMMEGNEQEFRRWIYAGGAYTGRENHGLRPVIHGELFEPNPIQLRRKLVEAYPELLRDERVKDLEYQVEQLKSQVNRLEEENHAFRERFS